VAPIAICITPPGLYIESLSIVSLESAIVNLLLCHTFLMCALSGTSVRSVLWHASLVSVKPIIVGCRSAALFSMMLRRIGFAGSPFMFCRMILSRPCGLGVTS
jgi:hypothetical protein